MKGIQSVGCKILPRITMLSHQIQGEGEAALIFKNKEIIGVHDFNKKCFDELLASV